MNPDHAPDPEFVRRLEWEVATAARRYSTLHGASTTLGSVVRSHWGATLGLVVASIFVGGAGTYATIQGRDDRDAALHIARAEALLEIAQIRMEPVKENVATVRALHEAGRGSHRELREFEEQLANAEAEVLIRTLDLEESRGSGRGPNDALTAPLVEGRDFVTERLTARRRALQFRADSATEDAELVRRMNEQGIASRTELVLVQAQVAEAEAQLAAMGRRLELRASFLAGRMSTTDVELGDLRLSVAAEREAVARKLETLDYRRSIVAPLVEADVAPEAELQTIDSELQALGVQLELADLELSVLDRKLREAARN